jgi:hypothetical protein
MITLLFKVKEKENLGNWHPIFPLECNIQDLHLNIVSIISICLDGGGGYRPNNLPPNYEVYS